MLLNVHFFSYSLLREVTFNLIIPSNTFADSMPMDGTAPSHTIKGKFPVIYLLHGYGNDATIWGRYTNVELYAEERQIAVAMISGENKFYQDVEVKGYETKIEKHFEFLSKELPEFLSCYFPISVRREDSYIAGLSMGSMAALRHVFLNPEQYCAIGAFSGPLVKLGETITNPSDMITDEGYELIKKAVKSGKQLPKFYMSTGTKDRPEYLHAFVDYLRSQNMDVTTNFEKEYGHEWRCWDENIEEFMDWIPRTDVYANQKRKI